MIGTHFKSLPEFKSTKYHSYIKSQPCLVCGCSVESPHHHKHTGGKHARDQLLVPLCLKHHNEFHYNESKFIEKHFRSKEHYEETLEELIIKNITFFIYFEKPELRKELMCAIAEWFASINK